MTRAKRLIDLLQQHGRLTSVAAADLLQDERNHVSATFRMLQLHGLVTCTGIEPSGGQARPCYLWELTEGAKTLRPRVEPKRVHTVRVPEHQAREPLRYVEIRGQRLAVVWDGTAGA